LLSSIPQFLELVQCIIAVDADLNQLKENGKRFMYFDSIYAKTMETLRNLKEFLTNSIVSNMIPEQEFEFPSPRRQLCLREQCLFGLLLWLLSKVFPRPREFETL
jgi:hypothetical protein